MFVLQNDVKQTNDSYKCLDPGYIVEAIGIININHSTQLIPLPERICQAQNPFSIIDSSFSIHSTIEYGRNFRIMSFKRAKNGDDLFLTAVNKGAQLNLQRKDTTSNNDS